MAEDVVTLGIGVDSTQVKEAKTSLDQLSDSSGRAEKSTNNLTSASDRLAGVVRLMASAYATLRITQYAQEAAMLSQRYQQMGIVMGVVAANTGQSKAAFESTSQSLQKLGISMLESRNTVIKLATANIDLANAEKLADLARNAAIVGNMNTSQALDTLVHGIQSAQVEVLRTIGINVNFERSYADLAKQLGVNSNNLTEAQKQQARMNVVLAESVNFNGLYEASLANAGKMMKSTERLSENLKIKIGAIFDDSAMLAVSAYSNQLLDLNSKADRFAANGAIKDWSRQIAIELAFVMDMGKNVFGIFGALGGLLVSQAENIRNLDFSKMTATFANADKELKAVLGDTSKYQDMVKSRIVQEDMLTDKITGQNNNIRENTKVQNENTEAVVKAVKAKQQLTLEELRLQESTKATIDLDRDVKNLTQSVATEQEKYNQALAELNRLKPYVSAETYERALTKLNATTEKAAVVTRDTTDQVSQLWMQAGRNIQSTLANSIFNFFDDGLKGMLKNVISTVGRIASEFAALKLAQGIGLAGMFGMSGTASASSGSGGGSLLNIASMGSSAMSMLKGGFGVNSLISGIGGMLPGSAGAFFGGMGGGAVTGVSSQAALAGSSFGAAAGPAMGIAMAAMALDAIGNAFAGDKTIGGSFGKTMQKIPVLGTGWDIAAGLFGHGPMKFRQQSLQGDISSGGFDGSITNVDRAKGGLFVKNKHRSVTEQLPEEMQLLFDQTITGFYDSTHKFAENLGLDVSLVDNFTKTIQIKSEKNQKLTEEAIADLFKGLNNDIAKNVLPTVDTFKKAGEDSSATLARLSSEFDVLTNAAELLLGKTNKDSKSLISGMGIGDRTSFIDAVGGAGVLSQFTSFYSEQFLTQAERLKPVQEGLVTDLEKLGLSSQLTREEFRNLIQSVGQVGGISQETFAGLIKLAGAFDVVRDASEATTEQARQYSSAVFQQRLGIESQLLQLQGNTAELRRRELMQLEPANRALQQRVFDLIDEIDKQAKLKEKTDLAKKAADDLAITLKDNLATALSDLDTAFSKLTNSVSKEKDILAQANTELEKQKEKATERFNLQEQDAQNRYNALIQKQDDKIAGVVANSAKLAELSQSITGAMLSLQPMSAAVARGQANNAAASGNIGGYDLSNTVSILGQKIGSDGFSNRLDMLRANAANFNALSGLQNAAGGEMSLGDRTIAALEAAKETFADGLNAQLMVIRDSYSVQITQYDAQIKANDGEMLRLDGLLTTAQTQIDVLKGIDSSVLSVADALRNLNFAMSGVTTAQTAIDTSNIAKFDIGGKVPRTGLAIIHKDEQITSAKDSAGMTEQIAALKTAVEVLTIANNKMNRRFDKWDKEGLPTTRTA